MPKLKGIGIRRAIPFSLRLNKVERKRLELDATAVGLPMVEFARCKIFDVPFEMVGGKSQRQKDKPTETTLPTD